MNKKQLTYTTVSSIIYQVTAVLCGFVLPRLILVTFGSQVNGLTNTITQFLTIISFLDLGVGAVVRSSLYKPLAENDVAEISKIYSSANKFFSKIALILTGYVILLIFLIPLLVNQEFDFWFTASLVLAMSISSFAQYYFGIVNGLLVSADQKGYIQYNVQTVTVIINTAVCFFLIYIGGSIQLVKLTTSLIFVSRPLYLKWYVSRHYSIDKKIKYEGEPISQKWNGLSQHVAAVVLDNTDTIILSVFATLSDVSVYSVYFLVIHGVKQLFQITTNGIQAFLGNLWVRSETTELKESFGWIEWGVHTSTVFAFGCTAVLIVPFVEVYTLGVSDVNYIVPVFAVTLTLAHAIHCLRIPYHCMILAAGHYKQTQHNYIIAMMINIIISIFAVNIWGLIGVALGTLIAMIYQTIWMSYYDSSHLLYRPVAVFTKQMMVDALSFMVGIAITSCYPVYSVSYIGWFVLAVFTAITWVLVVVVINYIFYKDKMIKTFGMVRDLLKKIR